MGNDEHTKGDDTMKRTLMTLVPALLLGFGSAAFAAEPAAKPDCTAQQKAVDDANTAAKAAAKPDLSRAPTRRGRTRPPAKSP